MSSLVLLFYEDQLKQRQNVILFKLLLLQVAGKFKGKPHLGFRNSSERVCMYVLFIF